MQRLVEPFALSADRTPRFTTAGSSIPVLQVDGVYDHPDAVREMALALPYAAPPYPYPGKLAVPPESNALSTVRRWALEVANDYLRHIPPITRNDRRIRAFRQVYTDFAIIDVHPDDLSPVQRQPHVDPVPVFGLIYLNREERGGTLFFDKRRDEGAITASGYPIGDDTYELRGQIEAVFNRMAIYPGFIPHSGQIAGDWIKDERRFTSPRLTQRFVFLP